MARRTRRVSANNLEIGPHPVFCAVIEFVSKIYVAGIMDGLFDKNGLEARFVLIRGAPDAGGQVWFPAITKSVMPAVLFMFCLRRKRLH
jgi:hypothetical protein